MESAIFRRYDTYPQELIEAAAFRDQFDELPDGAFFALAEEQGLYDSLIDLGEFEKDLVK